MITASDSLAQFGAHRVLMPLNSLPQGADTVDPAPALRAPEEALVSVSELMLDSTSMCQLRAASGTPVGSSPALCAAILAVVAARGKCHNPVTNSGGVLVGTLTARGARFGHEEIPIGALVSPLSSLSAIPLSLSSIEDVVGDRVVVLGTAVVFASTPLCPIPADLGVDLSLACIDISSIVPQVARAVREAVAGAGVRGVRVLVLGCGKAGLAALATIWALRQDGALPQDVGIECIAVDAEAKSCARAVELGIANRAACCDARDAKALLAAAGAECDLVINVVNVPGSETATALCTRAHGTVLWFSMATRFDRAALASDAIGRDVRMLVGTGVADGQAGAMFALVRRHAGLRDFFARH